MCMKRDNNLIAAYLFDGNGGAKKIGWNDIVKWAPERGVIWVHLDYTIQATASWLSDFTQLDRMTAKALVAQESRPRCVATSDGLLLFLRGVNTNPGQDPEDMVSIRTWVNQHCIITTRKRQLLSVIDIMHALEKGVGPKTPAEFLRTLNDCLLDRISNVIENIGDQVDELEQEVMLTESHLLRAKIADLRRQSISLRRYLAPQREALSRLYHHEATFLSATDKLYLREANDRTIRYIEDLDSARERAGITQEELVSRLSEQMNRRMYLLSVVAAVFLPLSFITGLLGINVGGMPGANYQWAFLWVTSALLLIMLFMLWVFHKKKWF